MFVFDNTETAFSGKTDKELRKAHFLFLLIKHPLLVRFGKFLLNIALFIHFPVKWIIKPTIFKQFCGGENISECEITINKLADSQIKTILDYSAEGSDNEVDFDITTKEILSVIQKAKENKNIPYAVFKPSGIFRFGLLERKVAGKELSENELLEFERTEKRFESICFSAYESNLPLFLDAEESWIQNAVDELCLSMMRKYNGSRALIFNTLQMYRTDRLEYLKNLVDIANQENFYIGLKLVRGAYMEKERERALKYGYLSPVYKAKTETDAAFNNAIEFCFEHNDRISFCCASHNELSNALLVELLTNNGIKANDNRFWFAQLYGMSDHISFNLAASGYHVCKYVPYGPVKSVMPYLIRRAKENTSVAGQTGRELQLIETEMLRRKILKQAKKLK